MSLNSVLVIGAGNFGAATALSLARHESSGKVILIDSGPYPNPRAASHDINKIVRDDYPDPAYTKMMVEAMARWRSDGLYSPYYHETGIVRADPNDYAERSIKSYKALGFHTDASFLSVDEARTRWGGVFASANFDGVDKVHWNPHGGWAEADKALAAVIQAAIDNGVKYRANEATKLLLDSSGACIGARLNDGSEIHVETVVLAAGASSSTLLYQSDPSNVALHTGDRAKSTSAMTFFGRWDNERRERFKDVPVMVNWTDDVKGESACFRPFKKGSAKLTTG
jgi:sarcosine oxidase/L-pipecolate oxidase